MCLGAIYWARPKAVYYGCTKQDAANINFDDAFIYKELKAPITKRKIPFKQLGRENALKAFQLWSKKQDKNLY